MNENQIITMDDIYMALESIEASLVTGLAGLHEDLEKVQRLVRENTDAVYLASERQVAEAPK